MSFPPLASPRRCSRAMACCFALAWFLPASAAFAAEPATNAPEAAPGPPAWADFVETKFPFFSSVLDARKLGDGLPADNLTPRGIILNLGNDCWACFDIDLLRMSAVWTGQGVSAVSMSEVSYHSAGVKAIEGQANLTQLIGTPWLANGIYPGWQASEQFSLTDPREPGPDPREAGRGPLSPSAGRFKAVRLIQSGVSLEYEVADTRVVEWVEARLHEGQRVVQRRFRLEKVPHPLWLILGRRPATLARNLRLDFTATQTRSGPAAEYLDEPDGLLLVCVHRSAKPIEFQVALGLTNAVKCWARPPGAAAPAPARWPQTVRTRGLMSATKEAYVLDDIALPLENPWQRNVRLADIAFFHDGRAAAVTFDGDVWMISGLDGDLRHVVWRRFASGLHEPLSLCVRGEELFVFDRNGIWRLRDTDGNGEADVHELFSNAFAQTAETREYAQGMKVAPDGSFIIAKGGIQMTTLGKQNGSVLRVSPDGKSSTVLGWGLRSPFLGVHPKTGLVTASDQQGHYVPSTPLHIIAEQRVDPPGIQPARNLPRLAQLPRTPLAGRRPEPDAEPAVRPAQWRGEPDRRSALRDRVPDFRDDGQSHQRPCAPALHRGAQHVAARSRSDGQRRPGPLWREVGPQASRRPGQFLRREMELRAHRQLRFAPLQIGWQQGPGLNAAQQRLSFQGRQERFHRPPGHEAGHADASGLGAGDAGRHDFRAERLLHSLRIDPL